ncbi:MAG: sugar ABC transporter substrate-binding protein [Acidobacteria bacterium]|nr:sugar ABC transporter substrate-binding protein [Acidobacteriota bacterium]
MKTRIWILFSVFALIAAACGGGSTATTAGATESPTTTATESPTPTKASESSGTDTTSSAAPAEPTTIRYFTFSAAPDNLTVLDEMIAAFEAQNPDVKVEVETAPFDDYFTLLQTQIAGGDAPDTFELNFENFVSFASKGTLADLGPLTAADSGFDGGAYYQPAFDAFSVGGTQYGLPASYSTVMLFYNKDLFDAAGVAYPTDTWTWSDERAAAEAIGATDENVWGSFAGVQFWEFYKTAAQNGCSFFSGDQVTLNDAGCVDALQFMIDNVNSGLQPTSADMGGVSDGDMFINGELGMITTGIWMFSAFEDNDFGWDVVVEPGNTQGGSHFFANGVAVSAASDKQEAAYRWLRFFTSSDESARLRVGASWELPTLTDSSLYDEYLAAESPANRAAVLASLANVVVPPVIERQAEMQDSLNSLIERALAGEMTVQEALDQAKAEVEALLN